jgi:hypothetical protein
MTYLIFAASYFVIFAWRPFMLCLDFNELDVSAAVVFVENLLLIYFA